MLKIWYVCMHLIMRVKATNSVSTFFLILLYIITRLILWWFVGTKACCHNVRSSQCKASCRAMFVSEASPSQILQDNLIATCASSNSSVIQCVRDRTRQRVETTLSAKSELTLWHHFLATRSCESTFYQLNYD